MGLTGRFLTASVPADLLRLRPLPGQWWKESGVERKVRCHKAAVESGVHESSSSWG